ncbi:glycine betaine ABC transporter substrate-binding protein [Faecalicatena faecalis]
MNEIWIKMQSYFANSLDEYLTSLGEHISISLLSLLVAAMIGIPLGYLCIRYGRSKRWIVGIFQVLRIIPSLAVLILLIPIMGTGVRPAMTALVLLAIPSILMNTADGFEQVPKFMLETAAGMGMTQRQIFWKVKVPLAVPYILTGARTAMIEIIASATIAAKIGAGGLGGIIFTGLGLNRTDLLLVGGVSVALLSILAGVIFNLLDRIFMRYKYTGKGEKRKMRSKMKRAAAACLCMVMLISLTACGGNKDSDAKGNKEAEKSSVIRVGSKDFTEGMIVSEIYALALEDAGYQVERVFDIAGSVIHTSIVNDEIDLYPEYTGTGLLSVLGMDLITDPQEVYDTVKDEYEKQFQLTWLDYSQANDGQGLVIRTDLAKELGIKTISDLQKHASELRFASQGEFNEREDGIPALEKTYGKFDWKSSKVYDGGLKYEVLSSDEADVTPAYTTEGPLADKDKFTLLEDDKHVWPPYNLAPVVRDNILKANPDIADILNAISAKMDTESITALNAKVDVEKEDYEDVASEYYESIK